MAETTGNDHPDVDLASLERLYPEVRAGGYSRVDGTVIFYSRVRALLDRNMTVVNFGAGSGRNSDPVPYRRALQSIRGAVGTVIGVDVDPVVRCNPNVDEAIVIREQGPIPLPDESVDLILSDFTFEHVRFPQHTAAELSRILRPGGWICARTPNRWGYIGIAARFVPNRLHVSILQRLQPRRREEDVFPTTYRLNSAAVLQRHFPSNSFTHCSYSHSGPPAYVLPYPRLSRATKVLARLTPDVFAPMLLIFLQKRPGA